MKYTIKATRNTRFQSYKGNWCAEAMNGKHFICDASGDTEKEARFLCEKKVQSIIKRINASK